MMQFKNSLIINRPVDEVFTYIADFENMPTWNYFVLAVRKTTPGRIGLGTTFFQTRKTDVQQYTITEYETNSRVTVETIPPAPALQMRFTFEPVGSSTRLTDEWVVSGGLIGILGPLAAGRVKAAVAENLAKLRQLLETGEVRLQDGRAIRI